MPDRRSPARAWFTRYLIALIAIIIITNSAVVGATWLGESMLSSTDRVEIEAPEATGPAENFLVIGSDSREWVDSPLEAEMFGAASDIPGATDVIVGQRADALMIVRVDPKKKKTLVVSIPRDTKASIPGMVGKQLINRSYATGPQRVIDTIAKNFDVPIQHYVEVNFPGFREIIDSIGGITMSVPFPSRDLETGLDVKTAGCQRFRGKQALAWMRSRHFAEHRDGRWRKDGTSDFGRIDRQQVLLRALMSQAIRKGVRNPLKAKKLADTALEHLTIDSGLALDDVLGFARAFRSVDPSTVEMVRLPTTDKTVEVIEDEAEPILARLRGDHLEAPTTTTTRARATTTGATGAATTTTTLRPTPAPC